MNTEVLSVKPSIAPCQLTLPSFQPVMLKTMKRRGSLSVVRSLSLSFKQNRLSENLGAEHEAKSKLRWLAQAAVLSAGWRWAGPVRLPFGRPGDLPHGFGGSA
jgi:hypothetical protein